jgi:hypothetical protein
MGNRRLRRCKGKKGAKRISSGPYLSRFECLKNIVELATLANLPNRITEIFMIMLPFGR